MPFTSAERRSMPAGHTSSGAGAPSRPPAAGLEKEEEKEETWCRCRGRRHARAQRVGSLGRPERASGSGLDLHRFEFYGNVNSMPASSLQRHAAQLAALGSPVRLAILRQVVQGDSEGTPVGAIQGRLEIPWSTLSHHLDRLTAAGLLQSRPDGRFVLYRAGYAALRALTDYLWEDCCKGGSAECCPPKTRSRTPSCTSSSRTSR
jgi:DNA-binding transcriptional ArsR family regulator